MSRTQARFRARTIGARTLDVLTGAVHGEPPAGHDDEWAELVAAGIATPGRRLRPAWREVLTEAAAAPIRLEVDSRLGRAGTRTLISLTPRVGLAITERRRLTVTSGEVVVDAVEDAVEIALFDPALTWPVVQRVLPPSPAVRADGAVTALDERTVGVLRDLPERSALPDPVLTDLAGADVEVGLVLQVDNGTDLPFVTARHWLEGGDGRLREVRLLDDEIRVLEVPRGTIAREVTWLTVGAFDLRSRTRTVA